MDRKQRDNYYKRKYGITLEEYEGMLKWHNGGCHICGRIPELGRKALAVDHDHSYRYIRIVTGKVGKLWQAQADFHRKIYYATSISKNNATKEVRSKLKKAAVRGLLDWRCNTALQKWRDNPELMRRAAEYIERYLGRV